METLLKGSFSLLAIKSPQIAFKVSVCNIHLFFELFSQVLSKESRSKSIDFKKVFNFLFETVRGLLIYAKEGKFDFLFIEEGLIKQLCLIISTCFIENSSQIGDLLS